jgi:hypothetical protein
MGKVSMIVCEESKISGLDLTRAEFGGLKEREIFEISMQAPVVLQWFLIHNRNKI